MANPEHLEILDKGIETWNQWRQQNRGTVPDLSLANLQGAQLGGIDFSDANFNDTILVGANLRNANLRFSVLQRADLTGANLRDAYLVNANLVGANLVKADLSGSDLGYANLYSSNLSGAYFIDTFIAGAHCQGASFYESVFFSAAFVNLDLSEAEGIDEAFHEGPSSVGVDTLSLTLRGSGGRFTPEQLIFFESAGVPRTLLEYLPSILETEPLQFYSSFISYSTANEQFATKLTNDLNESGIKTWKWNLNAVAGRDLNANIDRAIKNYDKLIILCSIDSLLSRPVQNEIRWALDKEGQLERAKADAIKRARDAGEPPPDIDTDVLVPINLDGYIFEWDSPLATQMKHSKYIPDFTEAIKHPRSNAYKNALADLIHALNPKSWFSPSPKT